MDVQTFRRLAIYVIRHADCTPSAVFAEKVLSCIMVVVVGRIQVAGDEKQKKLPWLTKNGYSLVDSSVDTRESYLGELQMW